MNGVPNQAEDDRELRELRARAYGRDSDIGNDPAALARLAELEAARAEGAVPDAADAAAEVPSAAESVAPAHVSAVDAETPPAPDAAPRRSRPRWMTATRASRMSLVGGAAVILVAVAYAINWVAGPHPDTTLRHVPHDDDANIRNMLSFFGFENDLTTLRGYETYRGVEPWTIVNDQGLQCLMIADRPNGIWINAQCMPPGVDLVTDIVALPAYDDDFAEGLTPGSVIRFQLRGDSVDVDLYPAPEAD